MRAWRPLAVLRALALLAAPTLAATEPPRAVHPIVELELHGGVDFHAKAPRAAGFEGGFDLSMRIPEGNSAPYGKPNVWVYVPSRFDPRGPLRLVVVFHGFLNCLASYTSPGGLSCTPGHPQRTGYDLPRQIERSGIGAIVVIPQLTYDERTSDPKKLGEPGALRALLAAVVERELRPFIGARSLAEVERVAFMASSGGYQALEPALEWGGVPAVRDIYLLDAFYMYEKCAVERFLFDHLSEFDPAAKAPRRFGLIYTPKGGALERSLAFKGRARAALERGESLGIANLHAWQEPSLSDLKKPITIVRAELEHDEIVARYFWRVLAASGL